MLILQKMLQQLAGHMPAESLNILKENWNLSSPVSTDDLSLLLKYKLLLETNASLTRYLDVTSDLSDRIYNHLNHYRDFDSFCDLLKTKELTHTRISRSLIHIVLDIKKTDYAAFTTANHSCTTYGQYARILGFRKEAGPLLHAIKKNSSIPMVSKLSDSVKTLDGSALHMLKKDIQASHIYESIIADKFKQNFRNELQRSLVIF